MANASVSFKALPPEEAIAYLKAKGFSFPESFDWRDVWQECHATGFTVAKSAGFDINKDMYAAVLKAKETGQTFEQFRKELTPTLQGKGWWGRKDVVDPLTGQTVSSQLGSPRRLRIIYDTNMRMAKAAGDWARIQRTKKRAPYLRYVAVLDPSTREQHRRWHGTILPVDHPWWEEHFPPNGWRCRCGITQLSERDLKEFGYVVSPDPSVERMAWTNNRTGEVMEIPAGIDPGFAYNPGAAALNAHSARAMMDKMVDAPVDLAAAQAASARFVVSAVKRDLVEWISPRLDALEAGAPIKTGERRVVGALSEKVIMFLRDVAQVEPASGAITLSEAGLAHLYREVKRESGVGLPREVIEDAADALWAPEAVYWDLRKPGLLYVRDVDGQAGKLVVRVNYKTKVKVEGDGKIERVMIRTNDIWSGRVLDPAALANDKEYRLIE